eukprot:s975_g2.t1
MPFLGSALRGLAAEVSSYLPDWHGDTSNQLPFHTKPGPHRGVADSFQQEQAAGPGTAQPPAAKGQPPAAKGLQDKRAQGQHPDKAQEAAKEAEEVDATLLGRDELEKRPDHDAPGIEDFMKMKQPGHKEYRVLVDTSTKPCSDTDGDVYIQLRGNRGNTGLIHLKKGMNVGTRFEFSIFARDVGHVETIRLANDSANGWNVDRVYLESPEGWMEFPFGQSLGWLNNPEATVLPSLASPEPTVLEESLGPWGSAVIAVSPPLTRRRRESRLRSFL